MEIRKVLYENNYIYLPNKHCKFIQGIKYDDSVNFIRMKYRRKLCTLLLIKLLMNFYNKNNINQLIFSYGTRKGRH